MITTPHTIEITSDVKRNIEDRIIDHKGLVEPVDGVPGEYSQALPS